MKKLAYVIAAISAIAIAAPSVANAEKIVIKRGHDWHHRDHGWHHRDHGWRHHGHDKVVIKHRY